MVDFARIDAWSPAGPLAERAAAEAFAAGAAGIEEREGEGGLRLIVYAPAPAAAAVARALGELAGLRVGPARPVPAEDWSESWKAGLRATVVSPRLVVRPSFAPREPGAGGAAPAPAEVVIDPGQAFGTGGHESTRLALEWIDALAPALRPGDRVLDVGTGSGVLALAAARLADVRAVGLDVDPTAVSVARDNAERDGLAARVAFLVGPVDAVAGSFDLVVANLLSRELRPLAASLARATRPGGHAVISGLLAHESADAARELAAVGLRRAGARHRDDASGVRWTSLLTTR